ncbi:MAG TPA: T9SS type A sorting domain-containing protein, partial [Ignavibacteriaceae bacterium]
YTLDNNYPNPFNPITSIKYSLKEDGIVNLKVYNIIGSEVAVLVNEPQITGEHSVIFDASNLASGTYIYAIRINDFVSVKKMVLLK